MIRRLPSVLSSLLMVVLALVVGCTDRETPTSPLAVRPANRTIVDGARGGDLNFFWLPPTVGVAPALTGPFDDGALDQLAVEVCQLNAAGVCTGELVERMTSTGQPVPQRIKLDTRDENYSVDWMTGRSHVDAGQFYRVRVLRNGSELGALDVQVVKNTPAMSSVNTALYVGIVNGQQLELRFRIQKPSARTHVKINEVESSGGVPGDWIELYNTANVPLNLAGYIVKDNDDTHVYTLPAGASIPAGGFYVIEEANLGFGLGAADAARFYTPDGSFLIDSYSWTAHAVTTYGRCPDGTGAFKTTTIVTKGTANDCSILVRINEIESSGGTPGDWVELYNAGPVDANIGGYVFRDNDDTHTYALPAGTMIPAGGYFMLEEAAFGFGLGGGDAARLFRPDGSLADSYTWTTAAATTYGRCPNGSGDFATTVVPTKSAANNCAGSPPANSTWPGDPGITIVDDANVFGTNMSGLIYEGSGSATPGVLWAVRNGLGTLFRLVWNGVIWTPDATNGWGAGKFLRYPDGTGDPDAEGVTFAAGSAGGMYVSTERNNQNNGISRNSILRFDPSAAGPLIATNEWALTADLPVNGPNLGIEGITFVPDAFLTSHAFFDESKNHLYNPAEYANHAGGLFFVGVEANGMIYAYALNHSNNTFTRIQTFSSGFAAVMEVQFDRELGEFWAMCDNGCGGLHALLAIDARPALPTTGRFIVTNVFNRPAGMPNINNEGFGITPQAECIGGKKPVFWTDDDNDGGHAIRRGFLTCTPFF